MLALKIMRAFISRTFEEGVTGTEGQRNIVSLADRELRPESELKKHK